MDHSNKIVEFPDKLKIRFNALESDGSLTADIVSEQLAIFMRPILLQSQRVLEALKAALASSESNCD